MRLIEVPDFRRRVFEIECPGQAGIELDRREEIVVPEHIAEQERHTATDRRAVSARADGDHRLTDSLERQLRFIVDDLRGLLEGREAEGRVVQQGGHLAWPSIERRERRGLRVGRCQRTAAARAVERVNVVLAAFVDAERGDAARRSHRERRARVGDSAQPCADRRQLRHLASVERHAIQIRNAVAVGNEIERGRVRRPLRIDVLAVGERPDLFDAPAFRVDEGEPI